MDLAGSAATGGRAQDGRLVRLVPPALVLAACVFNLVAYRAELLVAAPPSNDHAYHLGLIAEANRAWDAGANPRDPWVPQWGQGFPVLRYYQNLPHLSVVLVHRVLGEAVGLEFLLKLFHLLLLTLLPASVFLGARWLGCGRLAAALAACCTPLLDANPAERYYFGLQPMTFLWPGFGLFAQLAGAVLFAPALGLVHRTALQGRRFSPAVALLSALWLSHLLLGYMACLLGLLVLARPDAAGLRRRVALRLAGLYAATAGVASYLLVPSLLESALLNRTPWEAAEYWDSFGAAHVLRALLAGDLLDGQRLPVLTALGALGLLAVIVAVLRRRVDASAAVAVAGALLVSVLLYFGRPTWGAALDLLPFGARLPLHRFLCGVQLAGLLLAGLGLAWGWRLLRWREGPGRAVLALGLTGLVLAPAVWSTTEIAGQSARQQRAAADELRRTGASLDELLTELARRERTRPGRGYAGASWDWGQGFRIGSVPVYMYWPGRALPAISYMCHTMSRNSDLEALFDPARRDHYDLFNVRYLLADTLDRLPAFAAPVGARRNVAAGAVDTPGLFDVVAIAGFVSTTGLSDRERFDLGRRFVESDWHAHGRFLRVGWRAGDRRREGEPVVDPRAPLPRVAPDWAPPDGAVRESWRHGLVHGAEVEIGAPGLLVLFRMTYHPGWRATVDGRPAETVMLSPSLVGVPVPEGVHRVELRYDPGWLTTVLFWLGLLGLGVLWIGDRLRWWPSARGERRIPPRRVALQALGVIVLVVVVLALAA